MDNLIEIVFEKIDTPMLEKFINYFIFELNPEKKANILLIEVDGISLSLEQLIFKIRANDFESIFTNFHKFILEKFEINKPSIQIIENKNIISCSLLFNSSDINYINGCNEIELIYNFSKKMASQSQIDSFFAGIEPAIDADTRIFTNFQLGPIRAL